MVYSILKGLSRKDNVIFFYKRHISPIYTKRDFRFIRDTILINNKDVQRPILFSNGQDSSIFRYISLDNHTVKLYLREDIIFEVKVNNIDSFGSYLYINNMFEPIDLDKILKIEIFDANGAFNSSWENSESIKYSDEKYYYRSYKR